ncbi:MFS transporter [Enterococcus casseliflavus]
MTFIGSWLTRDFQLSISGVGTAMIAIGAGNLIGTLFGSKFIAKWGFPKSLMVGILSLCIIYLATPFSISFYMAVILLTLAFVVNGFIFPIFMTTLQSTTTTTRSTISSLSNAAMYTGTTIGGIFGGILFTRFAGFFGIAFFTITTYLIVLLIYKKSGIFDIKKAMKVTKNKGE